MQVGQLLRTHVRAGGTFTTPPFCIGELWRLASEPRGYGHPPEYTLQFLRGWLLRAPAASLTESFGSALSDALGKTLPIGAAVFDVCIGVAAREAGAAELWTLDRRFPEIERLTVVRRPFIERL